MNASDDLTVKSPAGKILPAKTGSLKYSTETR